jgi:hypothetical protein
MGYREAEGADFLERIPSEVKQAMEQTDALCASAHYPLKYLLPKMDEIIQYRKDSGRKHIVCSSPWLKHPSGEGSRVSHRSGGDDT